MINERIRLSNRLNGLNELHSIISLQDVSTDLILMLCGEKIGSGSYRSVYEFNLNPKKYVIKIEPMSTDCNLTEFMLWDEIRGLKGNLEWVKNWFAPILYCSPNGKVIVMERTNPMPFKNRPDKVPSFFTDVKFNNFGWIGNRLVCHDYGFINRFIEYKNKFQKAEW